MSKSGRTGRTRTTVRIEKRIDGQRSGTALAFSAVAPWERPGLAAHLILSHPQRLALWSVPTIVTSCRHCGFQPMANRVRFAVNISIRANGALSEPINLGPATLFSVHALDNGCRRLRAVLGHLVRSLILTPSRERSEKHACS